MITPWYEAAAGMWGATLVLVAVVAVLWAVLRPLRKGYPGIAGLAERVVARAFLLAFFVVLGVRMFAMSA